MLGLKMTMLVKGPQGSNSSSTDCRLLTDTHKNEGKHDIPNWFMYEMYVL